MSRILTRTIERWCWSALREMSEIIGLAELNRKLKDLAPTLEKKVLRSAASKAGTVILRNIRSAAPVGKRAHRTFKGNYVFPGYLKRHIKKITKTKDGIITVIFGVTKEAFYGVEFLEKGTKNVEQYKGWFTKSFERSEDKAIEVFIQEGRKAIDKLK